MIIDEKIYNKMPEHLRGLFNKLPNPARSEVVSGFPETGPSRATPRDDRPYNGSNGYGPGDKDGWKGSWHRSGEHYDDNGGSAARFFYAAKASRKQRTVNGRVENKHPTVKNLSLIEYLCRLTRPPSGGIVLDPFAGSGTTALACIETNRDYILIEQSAEYYQIARDIIEAWQDEYHSGPEQLSLIEDVNGKS